MGATYENGGCMTRHVALMSVLLLIVSSCAPTTHQSFVKKADAIYQDMIIVLNQVEHPQDFYKLVQLRPLYVDIAELVILSFKEEEKNPQIFNLDIIEAPHAEKLKNHLMRIYALEGGRQAVENVAREGLVVLQKSPYHSKKNPVGLF